MYAGLMGNHKSYRIKSLWDNKSKSSIAYEFVGLTQKEYKEKGEDCYCGIFETEGSYDAEYAQMLGVDLDQFYYWDQADVNAEQGLDILLSLIRSGKFKVLIVNSVAGLVPKVEEEAQLTDNQMALVARLLSKALRQMASAANKHKCTIILINQLRESMSMFAGADSAGGKALRFYCSQRIHLNRVKVQDKDPILKEEGIKVSCHIKKNRYANGGDPYKSCHYYAVYGRGIDNIVTLPDTLISSDIIKASGAWLSIINEETGDIDEIAGVKCKWNGKNKLIKDLRDNEELLKILEDKL